MPFMIMALLMLAAVSAYLFFLVRRLLRFYTRLGRRPLFWLSLAAPFLFAALCVKFGTTCAIIVLHLMGVSAALDLAALVLRLAEKCGKPLPGRIRKPCRVLYRSGLVPVLVTAAVLTYGYFNMQDAVLTRYQLTTDKEIRDLKILFISDTHYDTIQDTGLLKRKVEEMRSLEPDLVILGGDIVEENTSKASMEEAFAVLGSIPSTYGTYYVYGNHDRQLYRTDRAYTIGELNSAIERNGIRILQDSCVELGDHLILAGREDASIRNRAPAEELLAGLDTEKYIVLADHQPLGAERNGMLGVDLMISGHTHAGQIWPIGLFNELTGLNYGLYSEGCDVVVSSGFTGWGFPIRTSKVCEYVLIEVN